MLSDGTHPKGSPIKFTRSLRFPLSSDAVVDDRLAARARTLAAPDLARICAWVAYAAVGLGIIPLARPILLPAFLVGHDAAAHQAYSFLFARALEQGQVPVRWVEGVADGLAQPLFNHYQVGFYYLVTLLHWAGPDLLTALKLTVAISWSTGGVFIFLLCRPLGPLPAAMASAVFIWSPYLLVDVYVRNAFPELLAIGLAPGVLWAADGVLRTGRRRFVCALAVISAFLLTTHPPTALIVLPLAGVFVAGAWIVHRPPMRRVRLVLGGALLGAGLSAFYVLPAVVQLDAVQINRVTTGSFDFRQHFVRPEWWFDRSWGYGGSGEGADDQLSMQLGRVQLGVLAASIVFLGIPRLRRHLPVPGIVIACWLSVVALALFMMTSGSAVVWEAVGPLAFVQFPWRLLMLPAIACGVLAAFVLASVRNPTVQAALVLCVIAFQWYETAPYREMAADRQRSTVDIDDPSWPATGARGPAFRESAYDPVSVRRTPTPAPGRWTIAGTADVTAIAVADSRLELAIAAPEAVTLVINSPFYPGWHLRVDGRSVVPSIDTASGYMSVGVPAGTHRVTAAFERDRLRAGAELMTLLSLVGLGVLGVSPGRTGRERSHLSQPGSGRRF